ncbi:MerC domain-containing protein [Xanthomonas massiliensis]|jgi:hypothetical protein|uniref:MerC domain-containing protein n=1 Tax=Xanthomonas massiliensis TaxID=1720302 RepID=UPI0008247006|nr:MerC domain-containing protein [Xanthomonas massiliensis]
MPPSRSRSLSHWLDRFGATGSLLCAVHCAALPMLLALLPSLGLAFLLDDGLEIGFVAFVSGLGLCSLGWSYRHHRTFRALGVLVLGLALLWAGVLYPPLHASRWPHALVMTLGGMLVGAAHLLNLRLNHGHVHGPQCAH